MRKIICVFSFCHALWQSHVKSVAVKSSLAIYCMIRFMFAC